MHLFWFGSLIGLLAALSQQAGTASALIGLLFAFVGGSALTWYDLSKSQAVDDEVERKKRQKELEDRNKLILKLANTLALGALLGVAVGLTLKSIETYVIQPAVSKRILAETLAKIPDKALTPEQFKALTDKVSDVLDVLKANKPTMTVLGGSIDELREIAELIPLKGTADKIVEENQVIKKKLYDLADKLKKQGKSEVPTRLQP